jgi:hydrogenase maturation protein HypF
MHPDYLSTRWAQQQQVRRKDGACPLIPVQHHHAHLAACLAENGLTGPALGVTWDGTGYGLDGTIWGGEFLLGDAADFIRFAHLRPFRLPGGEAAVREPRRVALALLWELYGEAVLERDDLAPVRAFRLTERRLLAQMLARGINSPLTTSAGRLFDGVAALLGLRQQTTFEGQAAMALEFITNPIVADAYPIALKTTNGENQSAPALVLDWQPLIEAILADLHRYVPPGVIAGRFHNSLSEAITAVAQIAGEARVALTGGCFQNRLLLERTAQRLAKAGHELLCHRQAPANDGGISLGQIVVAAARLKRETG